MCPAKIIIVYSNHAFSYDVDYSDKKKRSELYTECSAPKGFTMPVMKAMRILVVQAERVFIPAFF